MMSDKALSHSRVENTLEKMATSSERRIEHRSIPQWGFTHLLQNSGRLGVEVGHKTSIYFGLSLFSGYRLFASSTDLAMEKTMEKPTAIVESGDHDIKVQRAEAKSVERSFTSSTDKTHEQPTGEVLLAAGDSSHEEG
jgi:hypothetical protein